MNVQINNSLIFKGHAAGRIKALYMQNPGNQRQLCIYNQMRQIGQAEGFDVFMHSGKTLKNEVLTEIEPKISPWGVWSQDNKIIRYEDGKPILIACKVQSEDELLEAYMFTKNRNIEGFETELIFDGGDIFLGKKDNGDNYLITSKKTLYMNAIFQYLKEKCGENTNRKNFINLVNFKEYKDLQGNVLATLDECSNESEKWEALAKTVFCEVMGVKPDGLIIVPETEFHLDLTMRPLEYPYILVNDDSEVDMLIEKLEKRFEGSFSCKFRLQDFKESINQQRKNYFPSKQMIEALEEAGFKPIKIAGMYGRGPINFMNAIVQKNDEGLIYITNGTKNESELFNAFQDEFERDLLQKCPQIKRVHFVGGELVGKDLNDMMIYLKNYQGGIHCLCCEEMEE